MKHCITLGKNQRKCLSLIRDNKKIPAPGIWLRREMVKWLEPQRRESVAPHLPILPKRSWNHLIDSLFKKKLIKERPQGYLLTRKGEIIIQFFEAEDDE
jgi:hypothetical protein